MALVADELQREWETATKFAADGPSLWAAAVLARAMQRELEGTAKASAIGMHIDGPELNDVLTRFATAVRAIPPLAPDACFQCTGMGFVHILDDQGEICALCGGSGVLQYLPSKQMQAEGRQ
jgi:hypothetical protein